jgi:ABC-2 type transport system permease protein
MWSVLRKEFNSYLNSLIAYIVIGVFLVGIGLFVWVNPSTNVLDYGYADLEGFFYMAPWVFLFLIPAITMRTFSEEKKGGTLELLFTRPLTDLQIILGKFFASWLLVGVALLPTLLYYISIHFLGNPVGNVDSAAVAGSYIGLLLLAGVFTAIGVFSSAITENQITAFIVAVFFCFLLYTGFQSLASIDVWGRWAYYVTLLGVQAHYGTISRGLIDFRDVFYFVSLIILFVMATRLVLESRKW